MYTKKLWKIESLWEKYYDFSHHTFLFKDKEQFYKNNISIYNPDFHFVKKIQFQKSENVVHSDKYGEYFGLKYSQVLEKDGKLVYLFDNHNKIIHPFLEYVEIIGKSFDVVHIDAHEDDAVFPAEKPHHLKLKNVKTYIEQTRISDFFDFLSDIIISDTHTVILNSHTVIPAKAGIQDTINNTLDSRFRGNDNSGGKLINKIYRYTKSNDFQEFKKPKNPYILSLDIDIFGPEGDFTDLESKVRIIAEAWKDADVVCIAMSPGFIDQDFARGIVEVFLNW